MSDRRVDLLFLAWNRLEFTRETFTALLTNTDWRYIHELFVYDDGSEDGTREWLENAILDVPAPARLVRTRNGTPVAAMLDFLDASSAPILGKLDNDAMVPPGWLHQSLGVLDRHPELSLLGLEALYPHVDDVDVPRSYTPARFIGGLGLYRREAFADSRPTPSRTYHGFGEWQIARGSELVIGWITPALSVFLLDRLPFEPWRAYSQSYIERGWQRPCAGYDPSLTLWHWRWSPNPSATSSPRRGPRLKSGQHKQLEGS